MNDYADGSVLTMNGVKTITDGYTVMRNGTIVANAIHTDTINADTINSTYLQNEIDNLQQQIDVLDGEISNIDTGGLTGITYNAPGDVTLIDNNVVLAGSKTLFLNGYFVTDRFNRVDASLVALQNEVALIEDVSGGLVALENQVDTNTANIATLTQRTTDITFSGDTTTIDNNLTISNNKALTVSGLNVASNITTLNTKTTGITYNAGNTTTTISGTTETGMVSLLNNSNIQFNTYGLSGYNSSLDQYIPMSFSNNVTSKNTAYYNIGTFTINPRCYVSFSCIIPIRQYMRVQTNPQADPYYDFPFEIRCGEKWSYTHIFELVDTATNTVIQTINGNLLEDDYVTFNFDGFSIFQHNIEYLAQVAQLNNFVFPINPTQQRQYILRIKYEHTFLIKAPTDPNYPTPQFTTCIMNSYGIWVNSSNIQFVPPTTNNFTVTMSPNPFKTYGISSLTPSLSAQSQINPILINSPYSRIIGNYEPRIIVDWSNVAISTTYTYNMTTNNGVTWAFDTQTYFSSLNPAIDPSSYAPHVRVLFRPNSSSTFYYDITGHQINTNFDNGFAIGWNLTFRQLRVRTGDTNVAVVFNFQTNSYVSYASGQYKILVY